jgi:hypothetical protein
MIQADQPFLYVSLVCSSVFVSNKITTKKINELSNLNNVIIVLGDTTVFVYACHSLSQSPKKCHVLY